MDKEENIGIWNMALIRNETAVFHIWGFCDTFLFDKHSYRASS